MPKFGSHILFAELAAKSEAEFLGVNNALRLGAVGPDLTLFLFDPIKDSTARALFDEATHVLTEMQRIREQLDQIKNMFDTNIADWLTGGLSTDLTSLLESGVDAIWLTVKLSLADFIGTVRVDNPLSQFKDIANLNWSDPKFFEKFRDVSRNNHAGIPFRCFGHPFTNDPPFKTPEDPGDYSQWWWMDMLHYRNTGKFATSLLANASTPSQKSYARGYLTHVAGDITGHPFINALVDGPFRNHAYRHMVLEGLVDTWLWDHHKVADISNSSLHKLVALDSRELHEVTSLLARSMRETYPEHMRPSAFKPDGCPGQSDLRGAYDRMQLYLKLSTSGNPMRPTPPPSNIGQIIDELGDILDESNPGPPPNWDPHNPQRSLMAMFAWAWRGAALIAMIATLPAAVLARIAAYDARWILYFIHLGVYMLISGLRSALALLGWGYASSDDFSNFGFLKELITVRNTETFPVGSIPQKSNHYWLYRPEQLGAVLEQNRTQRGPIPHKATPKWMTDRSNLMSPDVAKLLELVNAANPAESFQIVNDLQGTGFGNAVDFSIALLKGTFPIPDLDLDGDRGYGYRPWENLPPGEVYV